jgi:hypothetical protein
MICSAYSKLSSANEESADTPDKPQITVPVSLESEGDSIFSETMVDMTWQGFKEAAKNI